ncbi:MAG: hypothetical protein ACP5HX_09495 [Thermoproteota archaeon]
MRLVIRVAKDPFKDITLFKFYIFHELSSVFEASYVFLHSLYISSKLGNLKLD